MKVNVKQGLKTDVASALKLCTDQKSQEAVYAKLPGSNLKIKREGKAPNVRLRVSRTMPANPPAAIKRLVPATNEVSTPRPGVRTAMDTWPTSQSRSKACR